MEDNTELNEMLIAAINLIASYYNEQIEGVISTDIPRFVKTDKFVLHRYCFCEEEDCELCNEPEFFYEPYDLDVSWYKHIGRGFSFDSDTYLTSSKILSMVNDCMNEIDKLS